MRLSILSLPLFLRLSSEETLRSYRKREKESDGTTEGMKNSVASRIVSICIWDLCPSERKGGLYWKFSNPQRDASSRLLQSPPKETRVCWDQIKATNWCRFNFPKEVPIFSNLLTFVSTVDNAMMQFIIAFRWNCHVHISVCLPVLRTRISWPVAATGDSLFHKIVA